MLAALSFPALAQEAPQPPATHGPTLIGEPGLLTSALNVAQRFTGAGDGEGHDGLYVQTGMISGAGWISLGPGYRHHVLNDRDPSRSVPAIAITC
jgi:hypothetical protein